MKVIKSERYETSDGSRFEKMEAARRHEISLKLGELAGEGKLTGSKIIDLMAHRPADVVDMLNTLFGSKTTEVGDAPEDDD